MTLPLNTLVCFFLFSSVRYRTTNFNENIPYYFSAFGKTTKSARGGTAHKFSALEQSAHGKRSRKRWLIQPKMLFNLFFLRIFVVSVRDLWLGFTPLLRPISFFSLSHYFFCMVVFFSFSFSAPLLFFSFTGSFVMCSLVKRHCQNGPNVEWMNEWGNEQNNNNGRLTHAHMITLSKFLSTEIPVQNRFASKVFFFFGVSTRNFTLYIHIHFFVITIRNLFGN